METHIPRTQIPAFEPDRWLYQLFSPLAVAAGRPLHCDIADVEANIGRERLLQEANLRGYRVIEEPGQFTLVLNR